MEKQFETFPKHDGSQSRRAASPLIRAASPNESSLVASLIRLSFQPVAQMFGLTTQNCPRHPSNCQPDWVEKDFARGVVYFLLFAADEARGCVAVEKVNAETCYLERLAVLPAHQHQGYGKMLVDHVLNTARNAGSHRVSIAIIAKHQSLRTWYEKLSFVPQATKAFPHLPFEVLFLEHPL
jgi:GNAT superfamily N-acetyltransferase